MGNILAGRLREAIEGMDESRSVVIQRMADAAGIDPDTVNQIVSDPPTIDCPPLARLRGFARVLPLSLAQLRSAAEQDGCNYASQSLWYVGCRVDN